MPLHVRVGAAGLDLWNRRLRLGNRLSNRLRLGRRLDLGRRRLGLGRWLDQGRRGLGLDRRWLSLGVLRGGLRILRTGLRILRGGEDAASECVRDCIVPNRVVGAILAFQPREVPRSGGVVVYAER